MFTNKKAKYYGDNKVLLDSACLSSDTKPTTGVANGSKLLEMDTSTVYAFDEANGEWLAQSSSGGGGGGGGDGYLGLHTATVNVTFDTSEIEGDITSIQNAYLELGYDPDSGSKAISLSYDDYPNTLPVTDLGSPTEMVVPTSDDSPLYFGLSSVSWRSGDNYVIASNISVVSGDATQEDYAAVITGDCSLNIKVGYQG